MLADGTGADAFERVDDVVVLDDAGRPVVSRVTSGLALRPGACAVTDDAVAVAAATPDGRFAAAVRQVVQVPGAAATTTGSPTATSPGLTTST